MITFPGVCLVLAATFGLLLIIYGYRRYRQKPAYGIRVLNDLSNDVDAHRPPPDTREHR